MRRTQSVETELSSPENTTFWQTLTPYERFANAKRTFGALLLVGIVGVVGVRSAEAFIDHMKIKPLGNDIPVEHSNSSTYVPPTIDPCLRTYRAEIKQDPNNQKLDDHIIDYQQCEQDRKNGSEGLQDYGLVTTTTRTAGSPSTPITRS